MGWKRFENAYINLATMGKFDHQTIYTDQQQDFDSRDAVLNYESIYGQA